MVDRVSLVAPGATTQGADMRQRVVFLQVGAAMCCAVLAGVV
jgi:hypothetical protein